MTPTEAAAAAPAADFWSQLFVFVLASFIGLGVIRRVSRLLHTPLMSITNAISAIAVVGSIIVTGADYPPRDPDPRRHRAVRLDDEHRQRLPDHRPHAEDVQDRHRSPARAAAHEPRPGPARLPRRDGAVHLRAALDEHAGHGPERRLRRRGGHGARDRRHLGPARGHPPRLDRAGDRRGLRRRRAAVAGAAHRGAAADRALARVRRPRGRAWSARPSTTSGSARARRISRRSG